MASDKKERLLKLCVLFAYVLLVLTASKHSPDVTIEQFGQTDARSYLKIAHQPDLNRLTGVSGVYKQRFFWPAVCGIFSRAAGIPVEQCFFIGVAVLQILFLFLMIWIFKKNQISVFSQSVCFLLTIFNPYLFRYYLAHSSMLPGMAFITGIMMICCGLSFVSQSALIAGLTVAALSRQSVIMVIPAVVLWICLDTDWRNQRAMKRVSVIIAAVSIPLIVYGFTAFAAMGDYTGIKGIVWDTWYDYWRTGQFHAQMLFRISARIVQAYWSELLVFSVLILILKRRIFSRKNILLFILFLSVGFQIMLINPRVGDNAMRYFWHGYAPFIILLSMLLNQVFKNSDWFRFKYIAPLTAVLLIGSLHHQYSILSGFSGMKIPAFLLHKAAGLLAAFFVFFAASAGTKNSD